MVVLDSWLATLLAALLVASVCVYPQAEAEGAVWAAPSHGQFALWPEVLVAAMVSMVALTAEAGRAVPVMYAR